MNVYGHCNITENLKIKLKNTCAGTIRIITGAVRGLLCAMKNNGINKLKNNGIDNIKNTIEGSSMHLPEMQVTL